MSPFHTEFPFHSPSPGTTDWGEFEMTKLYVSNEDASVRMFKSNLLERLSHVHPAVPHLIFLPVIGYMLYSSYQHEAELARAAPLFLIGLLTWSITEYVVHRFLFHVTPETEDEARRIVSQLGPDEAAIPALTSWPQKRYFLAHGVHHDFPNDSKRLVMPPAVSIPLAVVFYLAFKILLGATYMPPFFTGFVAGYLVYDTTHYAVHHFRLRGRIGPYLKKRHFRHHYLNPRKDFGVSSPIWDVVMGTIGGAGPYRAPIT